MVNENSTEIGFEKEIWEAANELRGSMDAAEYKHVVLGLIFLKYLSDKFEERYKVLKAEGYGDEEDIDEYTAEGIFFVPPEARWDIISKNAHSPENGLIIDEAMLAIEKKNKSLDGILPKTFSKPELDKKKLGAVIDLFSNIQMSPHGDKQDILGRTYEYCLRMFSQTEGKNAGEFYTPACVVKTLVSILKPYDGRVYDPCCGSGGMFVQSKQFVDTHQGNIDNLSIFGQESNPTTWKMAKMNLAIRGIEANLGEHHADTFHEDLHDGLRADYILANPPFNLKKWGQEQIVDDKRWKYGTPPKGNANFAWIQHMIYHLSENGKIGLVLANGALSTTNKNEATIRQEIIENDLLEAIVSLPTKLFYTTGIPVSLWFLNKNKKQKDKTLFINARNMGTIVSRNLRELTDEDINLIANVYDKFQEGTLSDEKGFCKVVDLNEMSNQKYILNPARYVGFKPEENDGRTFEEKINDITHNLNQLFKESEDIEENMKKNLKDIGIEFN